MNKELKQTLKGKTLGKAQSLGDCCREVRLCTNATLGTILTGFNTREGEEGYEEWIVIKECKPSKRQKSFYQDTIVQRILCKQCKLCRFEEDKGHGYGCLAG